MANEDTNTGIGDVTEIFFYINPETGEIDDVLCFDVLGISYRYDFEWEVCSLEDSGLDDELRDHIVYKHLWDTDEVEMTLDFDFEDYDLITPEPVKLFDRGELTLELLEPYAIPSSDKEWVAHVRKYPFIK